MTTAHFEFILGKAAALGNASMRWEKAPGKSMVIRTLRLILNLGTIVEASVLDTIYFYGK